MFPSLARPLSDIWLSTRFSFQIALYSLVKQKENLTIHQVSLYRALFHALLQMGIHGSSGSQQGLYVDPIFVPKSMTNFGPDPTKMVQPDLRSLKKTADPNAMTCDPRSLPSDPWSHPSDPRSHPFDPWYHIPSCDPEFLDALDYTVPGSSLATVLKALNG